MAGLRWTVRVQDGEVLQALDRLEDRMEAGRPQAVLESTIELLQGVLAATPVKTGRARAGWVAALTELGAPPPAGWEGPRASAAAIQQGFGAARARVDNERHESRITIEHRVRYIGILEYGGSGRPPRAMVRRQLPIAAIRLLSRLSNV